MTLPRLVELHSDPAFSKQTMDGLKVLGLRGSTNGLKRTIAISVALESHFKTLGSRFPNAEPVLIAFQRSKHIQALLDSTPEYQTSTSKLLKYDVALFCEKIGSATFSTDDLSQFQALGELVAFLWLIDACIQVQSGTTISDDLAYLLKSSLEFVNNLKFSIEDYPEVADLPVMPVDAEIDSWVESSASLYLKCSFGGPEANLIRKGFMSATNLLGQLFPPTAQETLTSPAEEQNHETKKSNQRGARLSERERINAHHNAFHPLEAKNLSKLLRNALEYQGDIYSPKMELPTPYFYEALIALVAFSTGRTIRGALNFSLLSNTTEFISIELMEGFDGPFHYPHWNRVLANNKKLKLPLPDFLLCLARRPFRFNLVSKLEDCLPFSLKAWENRCLDWLETISETPKHKIDRRIRDALTRSLYKDSARRSVRPSAPQAW